MKINEAISEADNLKPNAYAEKDKIKWLSRLDTRIYQEIICTHEYNEGKEEISFTGYGENDGEKVLLVGEPYDELYIRWLEAQIDYNNMEYDGFNNANAVFEALYGAFRNAYNASHMPKGGRKIYF